MAVRLKGWSEQIASDQSFLAVVMPFLLFFVIFGLATRRWVPTSWQLPFAGGLAGGLLATVVARRFRAPGLAVLLILCRLSWSVLYDLFH